MARRRRKRKSKPTGSRRNRQQKVREAYAKAREDAQLAGVIPTVPEGAPRSEVVDPATQETPPLPHLDAEAVRRGWSVPEEAKRRAVDTLIGIVDSLDVPVKVKANVVSTLLRADQQQYERDHPERAGKAKGGTTVVPVSIQANADAADIIRRLIESNELGGLDGIGSLPAPAEPGTPGDSGQ